MRLTRGQAIRAKCLDCCAGQPKEVRRCVCIKCPLYPFRMGREMDLKADGINGHEVKKT